MNDGQGWNLGKDRPEEPAAEDPAAGSPGPYAGPPQGQPGQAGYPPPGYGQAGYPPPGYGQAGYPPPGYGQAGYPPPGYGPPGPYGYPPMPAPGNSGRAVAVLVCGISSVVTLFTCLVGFIPAIVALCLAPGATREINASNGTLTGHGMVRAGKICSWITIGLTLLGLVLLIGLVSVSSGSWTIDGL